VGGIGDKGAKSAEKSRKARFKELGAHALHDSHVLSYRFEFFRERRVTERVRDKIRCD